MKIGILFMSYNNLDTMEKSLSPFIIAKDKELGGHEFVISCVTVPFAEYKDLPGFVEDNVSHRMLETLNVMRKIDYLTMHPQFIKEHEARNNGLIPLLIDNCDIIINIDGDEIINLKEFEKAIQFVEENPLYPWFKLCYKNYIFDEKHYLAEPFSPPRIWRTKYNGMTFKGFSWDNDAYWEKDGIVYPQISMSRLIIPQNIFWAKHLTWLNNLNSKLKISYQLKHFNGICSYKWNEEKQTVEFNEDYYKKAWKPLPEVIEE